MSILFNDYSTIFINQIEKDEICWSFFGYSLEEYVNCGIGY